MRLPDAMPAATIAFAEGDGASAAADEDRRAFERVRAGDARALRALYDRHAPRLLALALRVLASRAEAEEVVQEVFVDAWRRAAAFDPARGTVRAWLTTMARSRAIDRVRQRGALDRSVAGLAREPVAAAPALEDADARLERERVGKALAELPEAQRRVIELAYYEGRTQREIAALTGEPLGTIKTRARLALEKLAALLGGGAGKGRAP